MHIDVVARGAAGRARAHDGLLFERVVEGLDPGACVRDAHARRVVGAAEILELVGSKSGCARLIEQRSDDRAGKDRADDRAVLGRDAE